ncbi:hypothetical protein [Streptacidiphilus anmyonensis]|uniref:hypothetical protein n=1 Tax=Streptacidiphilus anmyonensis TaxID=405782 RepID=UPI0005AABB70|nr:hypothetical protein [Streptacidiphilus anmyonensis]
MDSMRVAPSLMDRWWSIPRPRTVSDVASAVVLFLAEALVCLGGMRHWALGLFVASAGIFLGALVRRAPFTAAAHYVIALCVGLVMLPQHPPAAAGPERVPDYSTVCHSDQRCG